MLAWHVCDRGLASLHNLSLVTCGLWQYTRYAVISKYDMKNLKTDSSRWTAWHILDWHKSKPNSTCPCTAPTTCTASAPIAQQASKTSDPPHFLSCPPPPPIPEVRRVTKSRAYWIAPLSSLSFGGMRMIFSALYQFSGSSLSRILKPHWNT